MTEIQRKILNRGLTFVPAPRGTKFIKDQFKEDLKVYHRRVKLAVFFQDQDEGTNMKKFENPSTWTPPWSKLPFELDTMINDDLTFMEKGFKIIPDNSNLTKTELRALRELRQNKEIIIKPADKGSMVVVQDKIQYIMEADRQLNDLQYYKKLQNPIYLDTIPMVRTIVGDMEKEGYISAKQKEYLMGSGTPRERRFYILPKIHKDPRKWTVPFQIPPGRPIVSDCGSETYQTAEWIEHHLHPLSVKHPSFIKDTNHFVQIIKNLKVPQGAFFFSMDVGSLYTNIDIGKGLQVIKKWLQKYPDTNRSDKHLLQLLEINLKRNDFEFNGNYYLQIKGTAMGKRFAPSYANIFMANWEEEIFEKCPIKPVCFYRYLDDIFGIWVETKESFQNFVNILNSHDSSIQLTEEVGDISIDFLDTTVFKGDKFWDTGELDMKVHFKSTNKHALLHKGSHHPIHTYRGLIVSQLLRYKRICTRQCDFEEAMNILFSALTKRGYSRTFLIQCRNIFKKNTPSERDNDRILPLITKYSKSTTNGVREIKKNFKKNLTEKGLLIGYKVIGAFSRHKNLKDWLTRARMPTGSKWEDSEYPILLHVHKIQNTSDKTFYNIPQYFALTSVNCIFALTCGQCEQRYVGQTKGSLRAELILLNQQILYGDTQTQVHIQHFRGHPWNRATLIGLERDPDWTDEERGEHHRKWVQYLDTGGPKGLNSNTST